MKRVKEQSLWNDDLKNDPRKLIYILFTFYAYIIIENQLIFFFSLNNYYSSLNKLSYPTFFSFFLINEMAIIKKGSAESPVPIAWKC